jgi:muramoyltetrapeptide carboxypeptidase
VSVPFPPALRPGDPLRVIAPAGPFPKEAFEAGLSILSQRYRLVFDEGIFSRTRYLAGDDARRAAELNGALAEPLELSRGVIAARGGYGVMRILPQIQLRGLRPKWVVGFSDITALHLLLQSNGWSSVHGPVVTQLGRQPAEAASRLWEILEGAEAGGSLRGGETVVPGIAEGRLIGGNLSVLTRLLGTPYLPSLKGAVLLLEDVGEWPYRLDRMWSHLRLAGVLAEIAGVVLGDFTDCDSPERILPGGEREPPLAGAQLMVELAATLGVPCLAGLPLGHGALNWAVPLGGKVRLDATARRLDFLDAATATATAAE